MAMMQEFLKKLPVAAAATDRPSGLPQLFPCKFNCGKTSSSFLELVQHHGSCTEGPKGGGVIADADLADDVSVISGDQEDREDSDAGLNHSNASVGSSLNGSGLANSAGFANGGGIAFDERKTRVRTLISEEQLGVLKRFYLLNPRPKREELETIAATIGHPFKVVKVWFQNSRARDRREGKPAVSSGAGFPPGLGLQFLNNNITAGQQQANSAMSSGLFPRIPGLGAGGSSSGGAPASCSNSSEDPKSPCSSVGAGSVDPDEVMDTETAPQSNKPISSDSTISPKGDSISTPSVSIPLDLSNKVGSPPPQQQQPLKRPLKDGLVEALKHTAAHQVASRESSPPVMVNTCVERPEESRRPENLPSKVKAGVEGLLLGNDKRPLLGGELLQRFSSAQLPMGSQQDRIKSVVGTGEGENTSAVGGAVNSNSILTSVLPASTPTASNEDVYRFQEEIDVCGTTEQ